MVLKARKKPVEIECVQWTGANVNEIMSFCGSAAHDIYQINLANMPLANMPVEYSLIIKTLEGNMRAYPGDYIIKGVHGEFYPCKPDVFEETYEII